MRTNLDQLIGGATKRRSLRESVTPSSRQWVRQRRTWKVLEAPATISQKAIACNLEVNTAYTVISIDVSDVELGENIGARLQVAQAGADISVAQAKAEARRAEALARLQQMKAKVREAEAGRLLSEAGISDWVVGGIRGEAVYRQLRTAVSLPGDSVCASTSLRDNRNT